MLRPKSSSGSSPISVSWSLRISSRSSDRNLKLARTAGDVSLGTNEAQILEDGIPVVECTSVVMDRVDSVSDLFQIIWDALAGLLCQYALFTASAFCFFTLSSSERIFSSIAFNEDGSAAPEDIPPDDRLPVVMPLGRSVLFPDEPSSE